MFKLELSDSMRGFLDATPYLRYSECKIGPERYVKKVIHIIEDETKGVRIVTFNSLQISQIGDMLRSIIRRSTTDLRLSA
jgi:hypothetical protein